MDKDALLHQELIDLFELHRISMDFSHFSIFLNEKYDLKIDQIKSFAKQKEKKDE